MPNLRLRGYKWGKSIGFRNTWIIKCSKFQIMKKIIVQGMNFVLGPIFNSFGLTLTNTLNYDSRKREIDRHYMDYIRLATLELTANLINSKKIEGSVAELGVYKGKFARYINGYFPGRKFYLFDTFEGFDTKDIASEVNNQYSSGSQDFSDTSVESVLKIMPNRNLCVVCKGYFPDSANGVDDKFAFVSIDADLFDPIYSGLKYFYPRLNKGGYIFVHDYSNENYKGASEAVIKFCEENGLSYVLIPDSCGSAIISK